jgi:putative DNA primase/helicase
MANYPEDDYGLGFMLGDGWCGLDLDHVAKHNQEIDPDAFHILTDLENCGFAEWSPSGDGIHVIFWTDKPRGYTSRRSINETAHAEFYGSGRFFTVTGDREGFEEFDVSKSSEDAVLRLCERLFSGVRFAT